MGRDEHLNSLRLFHSGLRSAFPFSKKRRENRGNDGGAERAQNQTGRTDNEEDNPEENHTFRAASMKLNYTRFQASQTKNKLKQFIHNATAQLLYYALLLFWFSDYKGHQI